MVEGEPEGWCLPEGFCEVEEAWAQPGGLRAGGAAPQELDSTVGVEGGAALE